MGDGKSYISFLTLKKDPGAPLAWGQSPMQFTGFCIQHPLDGLPESLGAGWQALHSELAQTGFLGQDLPASLMEGWDIKGGETTPQHRRRGLQMGPGLGSPLSPPLPTTGGRGDSHPPFSPPNSHGDGGSLQRTVPAQAADKPR